MYATSYKTRSQLFGQVKYRATQKKPVNRARKAAKKLCIMVIAVFCMLVIMRLLSAKIGVLFCGEVLAPQLK